MGLGRKGEQSQSVLELDGCCGMETPGERGSLGPREGLEEMEESERTQEQWARATCLLNLDTHSGGWANWHPQVWFSAGVAAVYSGSRTHSPEGWGEWEVSGAGQPFLPASHGQLPSSQAYPPEPHQDPVGLGPGPLLIGSQEAPHHGDAPVKARGGRHRVRLGAVL